MEDRRKEKRIPIETLPDCFKKNILFYTNTINEKNAYVVDASLSGMCLVAFNVTEGEIQQGEKLHIKITDANQELISTVVYKQEIGENAVKIGVSFEKNSSLEKYQAFFK